MSNLLWTFANSSQSCVFYFCSLCIRRSLDFVSKCPLCRVDANPSQIRPNRVLDALRALCPSSSPSPVLKDDPHPPQQHVLRVQCPVCSAVIPRVSIHQHLDVCLGKTENQNKPASTPATTHRPHMRATLYHMLSDSQLRSKLRSIGLPTHEQTRRFVCLFVCHAWFVDINTKTSRVYVNVQLRRR